MMYSAVTPTASIARPDATVIALFEKTTALPASYRRVDADGAVSRAIKRAEFSAAAGSLTTVYLPDGRRRVYIVGLGDRKKPVATALRNGCAAMVRAAHAAKLTSVALFLLPGLDGSVPPEQAAHAAADGVGLGNFEFTQFKGAAPSRKSDGNRQLKLRVSVDGSLRRAFDTALQITQSVNLARTLQATPPNVANPGYIASECRKMARQVGLRCRIIDAREAQRLNMGGLLAVGKAGSTPPALIVLEHRPPTRAGAKSGPILLVGKAVTFDTGGYSIKPADSMDRMKYDKSGGMTVIGVMHAIARLKLPVHVVGLIPSAENLINQSAYRPGDIIKMHNGVTVEVINTDAEGRLILGDALAYGCRTYKPAAIVDLATLTGGVVVALGSYCAGCFCHDHDFRGRLFDAADFTGERLWHLPLWEEHRNQIKGTHGDIVNSAGREAHPIQGAAFLSYFVGKDGDFSKWEQVPWAHLDIAGTADLKSDTPLLSKGPTGFGVRLLVQALRRWR